VATGTGTAHEYIIQTYFMLGR